MRLLSALHIYMVGFALSAASPEWTFPDAPYRILIAVPPLPIAGHDSDHAPASVDLDFGKPPFGGKRVNNRELTTSQLTVFSIQ